MRATSSWSTTPGAGPYEATVESIVGSQAQLRVHLFAAQRRASVVDDVWARQASHPLPEDVAIDLAYGELRAFRAKQRDLGDA